MPALYPYRLFISHAWNYSEDYRRLTEMLDEHPNFSYRNYSVPEHDPLDTTSRLREKLLDQMNPTQVVIVLAGMYAAHSSWIEFEIEEARRMEKPIIGIRPWGQQRVPQVVQDAASVMHGWNAGPIVASIRELA